MDRNSDKLAIGRKKLKKFQARNSPLLSKKTSLYTAIPNPPPAQRMSSTEGLRELTNEISSLLSDGTVQLTPQQNGPHPSLPTLALPTLLPPSTTAHADDTGAHTPTTNATRTNSSTPSEENKGPTISLVLPQLLPNDGDESATHVPWLSSPVSTSTFTDMSDTKPSSTSVSRQDSLTSFISRENFGVKELSPLHTTGTPSASKPSLLVTGRSTNDLGLDQSPPTTRSLFIVNGMGGSGLSSAVSSRSQSARSSYSNLHLLGETSGTEYGGRAGTEYGNRTNETGPSLDSLVKAHAQTIDILVSEKATLQTELSTVKAQLSNKSRECSNFQTQLREVTNKIEEVQRERASLTDELSRSTKSLTQSQAEHHSARETIRRLRGAMEDQQQENTELISKITSQSAELTRLQSSNAELQSKLKMAELLTQQLSGGSVSQATPPDPDPSLTTRLKELEGETGRLNRNVHQLTLERDQAYSDLDALRDSIVQQQEQQSQKVADIEGKLAESEAVVSSLREELGTLQQENSKMKEQMATEHAHSVHSSQAAVEVAEREKETLQGQLEELAQENTDLKRLHSEQEGRMLELELQLSRLKEQSVDQQSLLTTIAQDKEAVSRAMSQNKELKANLAELQDAFVQLSQQNMELASDLETERLRVAQLKKQAPPTESTETPSSPPQDLGHTTPTESAVTEDDAKQTLEQESKLEALHAENAELHNRLVQLQSEHQNLSDRFSQLQTDHSSLSDQLSELQASYSSLSEEHLSTLHQLESIEEQARQETEHVDYQPGLELVDVHNMSADELTMLQQNFNALQQKFVHLVSEKVDLLEKLQENEHLIVQLSYETETIGDYITLYQAQRDALKSRFKEKDKCIEQLMKEKSSMQVKLRELQALVRQVLSEHGNVPSSISHRPAKLEPPPPPPTVSTPAKPHTTSDLPIHLRPQHKTAPIIDEHQLESFIEDQLNGSPTQTNNGDANDSQTALNDSHVSEDISHVTFGESQVTVDGDSFVSTATTEQILHLLDELDTDKSQRIHIPCRVCMGPILTV